MNNITWLEELAIKTHYDSTFEAILNKQSKDIQLAYLSNNQTNLRNLLGNNEKLPHKQAIFNSSIIYE